MKILNTIRIGLRGTDRTQGWLEKKIQKANLDMSVSYVDLAVKVGDKVGTDITIWPQDGVSIDQIAKLGVALNSVIKVKTAFIVKGDGLVVAA